MENQQKWHQKPVTAVLFLIFFFPVGLYLMWKNNLWSKTTRVIVSVFFGLLVVGNLVNDKKSTSKNINNSYSYNKSTNSKCEDMNSYNQGFEEGKLQRGILIDCDTYYPYPGWADNKECYCKGFNDGKNQ